MYTMNKNIYIYIYVTCVYIYIYVCIYMCVCVLFSSLDAGIHENIKALSILSDLVRTVSETKPAQNQDECPPGN